MKGKKRKKRGKKPRYPIINKDSLTMRQLARVPMPRPCEKHEDKKGDYNRNRIKKEDRELV